LELIGQVVPPYCGDGGIGLLAAHETRDMVNAMFSVAATGCQWRALPVRDPQGSTVHRSHPRWPREGTSERICDRVRSLGREAGGREAEGSAGGIHVRSVGAASTGTSFSRRCHAGKKVSEHNTCGVVETLGLLVATESTSDDAGGIAAID